MKNHVILVIALFAISFVTRAEASPWWWPGKAPVKTEQVALPSNNGGMISVTIPSKSTSAKLSTEHLAPAALARRARESAADRRDEERIAADLERHF